jgi:hypothetical protein
VPAYPGHRNLAGVLQLLGSFSASLASASRFGLEFILGAFGSSLGVYQKPLRHLYEWKLQRAWRPSAFMAEKTKTRRLKLGMLRVEPCQRMHAGDYQHFAAQSLDLCAHCLPQPSLIGWELHLGTAQGKVHTTSIAFEAWNAWIWSYAFEGSNE